MRLLSISSKYLPERNPVIPIIPSLLDVITLMFQPCFNPTQGNLKLFPLKVKWYYLGQNNFSPKVESCSKLHRGVSFQQAASTLGFVSRFLPRSYQDDESVVFSDVLYPSLSLVCYTIVFACLVFSLAFIFI